MMIKVCGMRDPENIRAVEALGIDMMGFIFWEKSARCVSQMPAYLPTSCKRVGVFVDAEQQEVMSKVSTFGLDIIQLHGSESPEYIAALRTAFGSAAHDSVGYGTTTVIIKALPIATAADLRQTDAYTPYVDYFLFDTKCPGRGGSGQQFDWSVLDGYDGPRPYLLSGGIGPGDAGRVNDFLRHHHKCAGIDLNSRFETTPGMKDVERLKQFITNSRIAG